MMSSQNGPIAARSLGDPADARRGIRGPSRSSWLRRVSTDYVLCTIALVAHCRFCRECRAAEGKHGARSSLEPEDLESMDIEQRMMNACAVVEEPFEAQRS